MTEPADDRLDRYLWDPSAEPDEAVRALEDQLAAHRFDPGRTPLVLPDRPAPAPAAPPLPRGLPHGRPRRRRWLAWAAAALLAVTLGVSLAADWRWSWPTGRAWSIAAAPAGAPERLGVGKTLSTPPVETAVVHVARIGRLQLGEDSAVTLRDTRSNRHRLTLDRGSVNVRVWAPPGSVVIETPAGEVQDLGCQFNVAVDGDTSQVQVQSGWVQLANTAGESLVPAGAEGGMTAGQLPEVPVFDDAPPGFREAVRSYEGGNAEAVSTIVGLARPRDVLTLLTLVDRKADRLDLRERLANRAAELWPPPSGVSVAAVLQGDADAYWRWHSTLPLPSVKGWLWNWRDALPGALNGKSSSNLR